MMNNDNQISNKTTLFGFIGEHAGVSRFSAILNKTFKANKDDVMMIPMNIRADDFFFTLANMKKSKVDGAVVSNEYITNCVELVDNPSELVKKTGMCDIVFREGETLRGDIFTTRVLLEKLKDFGVVKIAMIGTNAHAKAFSLMACGFDLSYYNDNLESLMSFCGEMEISNADVNRIALGMETDFSKFDAVLDFSDMKSLEMIKVLAPYNLDMKNKKEYSALQTHASQLDAKYIGYDDMIDDICAYAYRMIKKG